MSKNEDKLLQLKKEIGVETLELDNRMRGLGMSPSTNIKTV